MIGLHVGLDPSHMSFVAESERCPNHTHVLLITTGSVASIKAPLIVKELLSVRLKLKKSVHPRYYKLFSTGTYLFKS